jgi:hypothetical protein
MGEIEHPQQGGAKTKVCCPNCGRTLGDVIESLVRQRGRFKAQRNEARQQLAGAVSDLEAAVRLLNDADTRIIDTDLRHEWEVERARLRAAVGRQ